MKPGSLDRILDLGGESRDRWFTEWPGEVVRVNLTRQRVGGRNLVPVVGDGTALPFRESSFDIVFCNSVIEHLPEPSLQEELAREIQRVGKGWWVQTPNKWFWLEPHYQFPLFQFLSLDLQKAIWKRLRPGHYKTRFEHIRLLSARELMTLFPGSRLWREWLPVLGTKSLVAWRRPHEATRRWSA